MKKRTGEKAGWIAGWLGGFIWVLILAGLFFYRYKFGQGVVGVVLYAVAVASALYCAPWRHPSTPYWKLMLPPYCRFSSLSRGQYGRSAGWRLSGSTG